MKVKKAIKKIAALGMGATMLGATLLGASAANLADYPNMFIKDGQFDGYLVVGANAKSIDTVGMTNIALGLQKAAVSKTTVCTGSTSSGATASVDDGVQIDKSSSHFYLNKDIYDVMPTLDDSDLPDVLADGNYDETEGETKNDEDYTQVLNFYDTTGTFNFVQDDDGADVAGPYLQFVDDSGDYAYEYVLEFDSPVEYDTTSSSTEAEDLESTTIDIQGQMYTITEAKFDSSDLPDKFTLMVGDTVMWMTQDQTITKTISGVEHSIKMIDVSESEDACGFEVDGTTIWIDDDKTETVNGVTLGVTDAKAVHTETYDADICKVSLGASEIVLEDGKEVQLDGTDVEGSTVTLSGPTASTAGEWTGLTIQWLPEDNTYLSVGDELVDPVFGNFKFVFGGLEGDYEDLEYDVGTTTGKIVFQNSDNKEVEIPVALNNAKNDILFGDGQDVDELIYYGASDENTCDATDIQDCEGARWLLNVDGEAHLIELADIDTSNNQIDLKDLTYGATDDDNDYVLANENGTANSTVYLSGVGNIKVFTDEANGDFGIEEYTALDDGTSPLETSEGLEIASFTDDGVTLTLEWAEDTSDVTPVTFRTRLSISSQELKIDAPAATVNSFLASDVDFSDDNDDDKWYFTTMGTKLLYDSEDNQKLTVSYPADAVQAKVFVAPTGAAVVEQAGGSDCQVVEKLNEIPSTVNKLDTELSNPESVNLITVGGPCANAVTAALMGNPENCAEGFDAGMYMLKTVENGDKVALIVAGATGEDTLAAARSLQGYATANLPAKMEVVYNKVGQNNYVAESAE